MSKKKDNDGLKLRGFARVQLKNPDGSIAHETGFENTFVTAFRQELLECIGDGGAFASSPAYVAIGSGTAPATNGNVLPNEISGTRQAVGSAAVSGSTLLRFTGTFASDIYTGTISNMGLYTGSASSGSNLLCGQTFSAAFTKSNNQELSITYDITF